MTPVPAHEEAGGGSVVPVVSTSDDVADGAVLRHAPRQPGPGPRHPSLGGRDEVSLQPAVGEPPHQACSSTVTQ